ncbi:MAG: D-lyxose/D-mannose family sugar isomerase [Puniceicoccales bacterium]|jgi:D-lyxose ketol-isomerase|nr:D-lyxose/D-mannose family sugar isomerase [Puniceicoccales bacterium]
MKIANLLFSAAALASLTACSAPAPDAGDTAKSGGCCAKDAPAGKAHHVGKKLPEFKNADFYKDGKFNEDAAKDAVITLMKFYHHPVRTDTKAKLWVSDYGTGKFTEVGLAAIMVENEERDRYMIQALFLLPGQMLPEHWHEKPAGDAPAKMEGWYILGGYTYAVAEGEDNLAKFPEIKIPASHPAQPKARHALKLTPGEWGKLNKQLEHHWQIAGPQGAVMIEVANLHTNSCVKHLVPAINAHFLK